MLTFRQLRCHDEPLRIGRVWMCENPVVVAAGDAEFDYHGDFGWGGVQIAHGVRHRVNWRPWRYGHLAYESAVLAVNALMLDALLQGLSV